MTSLYIKNSEALQYSATEVFISKYDFNIEFDSSVIFPWEQNCFSIFTSLFGYG